MTLGTAWILVFPFWHRVLLPANRGITSFGAVRGFQYFILPSQNSLGICPCSHQNSDLGFENKSSFSTFTLVLDAPFVTKYLDTVKYKDKEVQTYAI